jgi:hypothetical protein
VSKSKVERVINTPRAFLILAVLLAFVGVPLVRAQDASPASKIDRSLVRAVGAGRPSQHNVATPVRPAPVRNAAALAARVASNNILRQTLGLSNVAAPGSVNGDGVVVALMTRNIIWGTRAIVKNRDVVWGVSDDDNIIWGTSTGLPGAW